MQIHTFDTDVYIKRRNQLLRSMGSGKILLLGNRESSVNFKDNWYPFRQDSTFLYYIGLNIPDVDVVMDADSGACILFGDELTIDHIIWTGPLPSLKELAEKVGITDVRPSAALASFCNDKISFLPPYRADHVIRLCGLTGQSISKIQESIHEELIECIISQRNYKSEEEVKTLHEACTNTSQMHLKVMSKAKSGMREYDLVGIAKQFAASRDVNFSFLPICTTRGHVLHNHSYENKLENGKMILFDGGLESKLLYAGDMTRTFPVSKKFSSIQAELYQVVLNAQQAAIEASRVGTKFLDVHLTSARKLIEGLTDVGIMRGNSEEAVNAGAHTMFFQCGLGHLMGLDVHDMENLGEQYVGYGKSMLKSSEFGLKSLRLGRKLEEGFVVTIEPGIYIIPELIDKFKAEKRFMEFIDYEALNQVRDFGGIRIEDDYIIRKDGIELLGESLPKEISEVELIRQEALS